MPHDPDVATFRVGCIPVSVITMGGLVASVARCLARGPAAPGAFVAFRDAHGVVRSEDDPRLRAAHEAAWLVVPDGRPLVWVGRSLGHGPIAQVPGIESVETLCRAGVSAGWRHYFLGGGPGVAGELAAAMSALDDAGVPTLGVPAEEIILEGRRFDPAEHFSMWRVRDMVERERRRRIVPSASVS